MEFTRCTSCPAALWEAQDERTTATSPEDVGPECSDTMHSYEFRGVESSAPTFYCTCAGI